MDEARQIRQRRLNAYIERVGGQSKFIEKTGINQGQLSTMQNGKVNIGDKLARKIEKQCELPKYWLDGFGSEDPMEDIKAAIGRADWLNQKKRDYIVGLIESMRGEEQ